MTTSKFISPALTSPLTLDPNDHLPAVISTHPVQTGLFIFLLKQIILQSSSPQLSIPFFELFRVTLDSSLSFTSYIQFVSKSCWLYLWNIPRIQSLFTTPTLIFRSNTASSHCLDLCNGPYSGISVPAPATRWSIFPAVGHTHSLADNSIMAPISPQKEPSLYNDLQSSMEYSPLVLSHLVSCFTSPPCPCSWVIVLEQIKYTSASNLCTCCPAHTSLTSGHGYLSYFFQIFI